MHASREVAAGRAQSDLGSSRPSIDVAKPSIDVANRSTDCLRGLPTRQSTGSIRGEGGWLGGVAAKWTTPTQKGPGPYLGLWRQQVSFSFAPPPDRRLARRLRCFFLLGLGRIDLIDASGAVDRSVIA